MSPRRRNPINQQLPDGLRVRAGYYSWTSPIDGREKGLGRDRAYAINWARAANVEVQRLRGNISPAEWVRGATTAKTWSAWLDRYQQILDARKLAPKTRTNYADMMAKARAAFDAGRDYRSLEVEDFAKAFEPLIHAGKARTAQSFRQWLIDCVRESIADGWRKDNPAEVTRSIQAEVQRARLELDVLKGVYDAAKQPWLRNSIALALVSGQRREDVVTAQRRDVREGYWWVEQHKTANYKTPARIAIPLSLRLDAFGMTLGQVIEQCRSTGILSPYLIHQTRHLKHSPRGGMVHLASVSRGFQDALKGLDIDWGAQSPPSFHEIRSLAKRLYQAQGGVDTKQLLGHKSTATADKYEDARGQWVKVQVKAG